jgi:hypothetical protein
MRLVGHEAQEVRPGGPVTLPPFPFSFCVFCESLWPGCYGFVSGGSDFESRQEIKKGVRRENAQKPQKKQEQGERCWRWDGGFVLLPPAPKVKRGKIVSQLADTPI